MYNWCLWHRWTIARSRLFDLGFCCFRQMAWGFFHQVNVFSGGRATAGFRFAAPLLGDPEAWARHTLRS